MGLFGYGLQVSLVLEFCDILNYYFRYFADDFRKMGKNNLLRIMFIAFIKFNFNFIGFIIDLLQNKL